ncbi:hypothetical protein Hdeb2414_s0144g00812711 [Helianthus debilis subsp. tardiflorus]
MVRAFKVNFGQRFKLRVSPFRVHIRVMFSSGSACSMHTVQQVWCSVQPRQHRVKPGQSQV